MMAKKFGISKSTVHIDVSQRLKRLNPALYSDVRKILLETSGNQNNIADALKLVLDFAALDYVSSAGLRVILQAQKTMNKQGEMVIRNVNESINEVFEVTGFIDILTIE